jgi:hypothetical protein
MCQEADAYVTITHEALQAYHHGVEVLSGGIGHHTRTGPSHMWWCHRPYVEGEINYASGNRIIQLHGHMHQGRAVMPRSCSVRTRPTTYCTAHLIRHTSPVTAEIRGGCNATQPDVWEGRHAHRRVLHHPIAMCVLHLRSTHVSALRVWSSTPETCCKTNRGPHPDLILYQSTSYQVYLAARAYGCVCGSPAWQTGCVSTRSVRVAWAMPAVAICLPCDTISCLYCSNHAHEVIFAVSPAMLLKLICPGTAYSPSPSRTRLRLVSYVMPK